MSTASNETVSALVRDLKRIVIIVVLIPALPTLAVLPFIFSQPETSAYRARDTNQQFTCGPENSDGPCRDVTYTWRSAWRNWSAEWLIPEDWLHAAIRESNILARDASRTESTGDDLAYWKKIYTRVAAANTEQVTRIASGFRELIERDELSRREGLEVVTGFAQSFEYAVPENYLQLYAPPQLLAGGQGDCDTRALFLALVLRQLGYDAVLLLSPEYRHAMVGVVCPSCSGTRLYAPGRPAYTFIETTARTPLGFLHPAVGDLARWHILRL